jgi:hypothetical protein
VPQAGEQPNDVRLGYEGSLNGAGNLVTLDGEAFGKLKGAPIQGLVASSAPGETVTIGAHPGRRHRHHRRRDALTACPFLPAPG